ncbi:sodium ion-translocating decarboxylase subunit beta [Caproiciproducens faecalis]|uniref:Sodium ion-translocating decarboxylase subunit beta n=1 Tax=Caproiciproducens faecalis TaxID=2820301 RepID=A0ABS7DQ10_9FIRM|nr:sodium ion-translocating decarboxylase subunit beta [Caproiciproducens faecalis]MBW7573293.1 sodium ion-translocating decarboxylase subunit beta [Caproiciproducens faecalis]
MNILNEFLQSIQGIFQTSGFFLNDWRNYIMIGIACVLMYLAIKKQFEPLLLLPIAFGMLLVNLFPAIMVPPQTTMQLVSDYMTAHGGAAGNYPIVLLNGQQYYQVTQVGGLFYYLYQGVKLGIYPPLIFLGIGAMTDFGPLISNPKSFLLGAAAQLGIFTTFIGAVFLGFSGKQAGSIGIIGGADGPTAIFVTSKLAPELLGPIAVAAYSYMALVPIIQPPIMKALTTKKERGIVMEQLRPVSKLEKILFPIIVTVVVSLLLPDACPLIGMLMLGNLFRESGVVGRISNTAQNELMNIITIFLGVTVGATATGSVFLSLQTIEIIILGLLAFSFGTAGGVLFGKLMCWTSHGKVNPLIGSAGVSAVPMAARVAQKVGQEENPGNFLLMHAMGPNVAGVIGSAVAAGVLISILG